MSPEPSATDPSDQGRDPHGEQPGRPVVPPGSDRGPDDDDVFAALVARFHDEPDARDWPASEELSPPPTHPPELPPLTVTGSAVLVVRARPPDDLGPDDLDLDDLDPGDLGPDDIRSEGIGAEARWPDDVPGASNPYGRADEGPDRLRRVDGADDEGHYEPPPPPPAPRLAPATKWALGSIALGVVFLLAPGIAGMSRGTARDVLGVLLVLGGVGTLVARMADRPPTDSDSGDDGAVV